MRDLCAALDQMLELILSAVNEGAWERAEQLASERDALLRQRIDELSATQLSRLIDADGASMRQLKVARERVSDDLSALRVGRSAVSAYVNVHSGT